MKDFSIQVGESESEEEEIAKIESEDEQQEVAGNVRRPPTMEEINSVLCQMRKDAEVRDTKKCFSPYIEREITVRHQTFSDYFTCLSDQKTIWSAIKSEQ